MRERIKLPRILGFSINGFHPIFNSNFIQKISVGPNIILGGNGLGKTTIMQAIVYGLTGGNVSFEEKKAFRWDHKYFQKRLGKKQTDTAYIQVDFALGQQKMSVRRGVNSSNIIAFRRGGNKKNWEGSARKAKKGFESSLRENGKYASIVEFDFMVHRVLYLPENRRLLAWDNEAQLQAIMVLNQDMVAQKGFKKRREKLQELDTQKRHTRVALNKIIKQISENTSTTDKQKDKKLKEEGQSYKSLVDELILVSNKRRELEKLKDKKGQALSNISHETEELREQIEQAESHLIATSLASKEKEYSLALFKLAEHGVCPACGTLHEELQSLAHKHLREHKCLLCGSEENQPDQPGLTTLRSQLGAKRRAQKTIERQFLVISNKLKLIKREEQNLQIQVNDKRLSDKNLLLIERGTITRPDEDIGQTKVELESLIAELDFQIHDRQFSLETEYKEFRKSINTRILRLRKLYSEYATLFLGIKCTLTESRTEKLIELTRFVPCFNDIARETPDSCSEAQRFFLDIAFRMALIDFAANENIDEQSMFICETPETALDLSYISNVVAMFERFSEERHSLIISSNIQHDSIAMELLKIIPKEERRARILNLLDIGQLSDVQKKAEKKLRTVVRKILSE